jgi:hypothetical protein
MYEHLMWFTNSLARVPAWLARSRLAAFIESRDSSVEALYEELAAVSHLCVFRGASARSLTRALALRTPTQSPPDTDNDMFVQILNATLDFDVFMLMMRETAKEEQRTEKEAKAATQRGKAR